MSDQEQVQAKIQYLPKSFETDDTVMDDEYEEESYFPEDDTY